METSASRSRTVVIARPESGPHGSLSTHRCPARDHELESSVVRKKLKSSRAEVGRKTGIQLSQGHDHGFLGRAAVPSKYHASDTALYCRIELDVDIGRFVSGPKFE